MKLSARIFLFGAAGALSIGVASAQILPPRAPNWYEATGGPFGPKHNAVAPSGRFAPMMTFDGGHNVTVLFGGVSASTLGPISESDTWFWNGSVWTETVPAVSPHGREGSRLVYDPITNTSLLFAGSYFIDSGITFTLDDTWIWNGSNWIEKFPANSPSARYGFGMTYDATHGVIVLFGGSNGVTELNDTWTWNGSNWTQLNPPNSPSARFQPTMTYDAANGNVVMFGGAGQTGGILADTWIWDGTSWTQVAPATSPSPRYGAAMVYDTAETRTVMFGGDAFNGTLEDTWTWTGTNWIQVSPIDVPMGRFYAGAAYDSAHGQFVMFAGGYGTTSGDIYLDSTYLWY